MLEKALVGSKKYYGWIAILLGIMGIGGLCFLYQWHVGLGITGMSRDVPWGFYIAQFTFLVGVAASAVMVVIPYYLHDYKKFHKMAILGEFIAIAAVTMCMCFIFVDMGKGHRLINVFLYPSPNSMMFWDTVVCFGYLILNLIIAFVSFGAERKGTPPPAWLKPLIYLSIPWAFSIHTVTAFLYCGLAGRSFWLSAIMAPRFLASAFAAGPSLLILLCLILRRVADYDVGKDALRKLAVIVTYAMIANVFFVALELFTALYSDMPHHEHHFAYMFLGYGGGAKLVPFMWLSVSLAAVSLVLLLFPKFKESDGFLGLACLAVFLSLWIDKGLGMVITGFIPNPVGEVVEYWPTIPEALIALAIWALGFLIITVLYKIAITIRKAAA